MKDEDGKRRPQPAAAKVAAATPGPGPLAALARRAADEVVAVLAGVDEDEIEAAVAVLAGARRIVCHGVGREGLQLKGLAMRLYHLGCAAGVVGDMICPPVGAGDLLVVSAGPGWFSTVAALIGEAQAAGARCLVFTAEAGGRCGQLADFRVLVPAQTMASDLSAPTSILPMGSLYEAALHIGLELLVLKLRDRLGIDAAAMRARHTNLE